MQKVTTFLTFPAHGAEAIKFYVSLFKNANIVSMTVNEQDGLPVAKGALMSAVFELDGQQFMAMDGGEYFSFSAGTSLFVSCKDQAEIDHFYDKLAEGGEEQPCGWVKDKYGVVWQVVPTTLHDMLMDKDPAKSQNVMQAMFKMKKIIIKDLEDAYNK